MKRVLVLLAVAAITANSLGCCCRRCCCLRNWFYQADYCCPTGSRVATPVAAVAPAPRYQYGPAPSSMMACPAPVYAPACPQPCQQQCPQPCAPTYAAAPAPTCRPACAPACAPQCAPTYGLTYASEPTCGFSSMGPAVFDTSWSSCEPSCSYPSEGDIIMESPGMVYPGPVID